MSALSNIVKTHQEEPELNTDQRCIIPLRESINKVITSNLRLADAGYYDSQVTDETGVYNSRVTGLLTAINGVRLQSGNTVIDEITRNTDEWCTIMATKGSNTYAQDLQRRLIKNGLSWELTREGSLTTFPSSQTELDEDAAAPREWFNANGLTDFSSFSGMNQISKQQYDGESGTIDLRNYLGALQSIKLFKHIPDLKLVITWNSGSRARVQQDVDATTQITPNPSMIYPVLLVDEIIGLSPEESKFETLTYDRWLSEPIPVPAVNAGTTQEITLRSQAFRDYFVKDLYYLNSTSAPKIDASNNQVELLAGNRAPAMFKESVQFVVNKETLPTYRIDNQALKCAMADDVIGPRHVPFAGYLPSVRDPNNRLLSVNDEYAVGNFSVGAVSINDRVNTLDINLRRTGKAGNEQDAAYNFLMFAKTPHVLEMQGGRLRVKH